MRSRSWRPKLAERVGSWTLSECWTRCLATAPLTDQDVAEIAVRLRRRIVKYLRRCGRIPRDEHDESPPPEPEEPLFAELCAASVQGRVALGPNVSVRRRFAARAGEVGVELAGRACRQIARRSAFRPRIAGRTAASSDPASARRRGWPDAWRRARGRRAGRRRDPPPHADSSRSASRRSPPPARHARCP